jgi:hypothetical protein
MAMKKLQKISQAALLTVVFFSFYTAGSCQEPCLEVSGFQVWVRNLNSEILYTFCRYYNTQQAWQEVFPVVTKESDGIAIDGTYEVHETAVSFTPRFPFVHGVSYIASFNLEELAKNFNEIYLPKTESGWLELQFTVPKKESVQPSVAAVYPSSDTLPENLLKFHIAFNTPMTRAEVYQHVKLLDRRGNEIEKAFLVVDQELWDNEMKMVTLLLDPGRIKRGLKPNVEMGPALEAGNTYSLVVEPGWENAYGDKTGNIFIKEFQCFPADRVIPETQRWNVLAPSLPAGVLTFRLNESFDRVLLADAIRVFDNHDRPVNGKTIILEKESTIEFVPDIGWRNEVYTVRVNPLLEDLAGNNLTRLFDEDMSVIKHNSPTDTIVSIQFTPTGNNSQR